MSKKICLLTDSLGSGGAEKMAANMSISLSNKGYEVFVVSMLNNISYEFAGTLYNFGLVKEKSGKLLAFLQFKRFFNKQGFDVIIDHRVRARFFKEVVFSKYVFKKCRVIYVVHHYDLSLYFTALKIPFLSRFPHVKSKTFVSVSKQVQNHLKLQLEIDSILIYNYVLAQSIETAFGKHQPNNANFKYVVAVGRLVKVKRFDLLISSYAKSNLPKNNIKLFILGEGPERGNLESLLKILGMEDMIELKGFHNNPYGFIKQAQALVMSSKYEGFPMVLIEALALYTPMVSFNCESGPSEIIQHNKNGLLVENQNSELLIKAMNTLLLNEELYKDIKHNMAKTPNKFSEDNIVEQWINLIENSH
ncbi:glycosyltransferase [Hwangdonia lutea]|uniref:Glycosyltransferase n=1 Tax=Hwangdonia lutea TaxID=3075823 RepID=A0AA97EM11_9FLAO|nr:glycosyltransferase [Hwangdonia sp. SCSIO 19198]WOD42904.1 glycosyltransferase [Hwangdonia sp. SCSIO 19198]